MVLNVTFCIDFLAMQEHTVVQRSLLMKMFISHFYLDQLSTFKLYVLKYACKFTIAKTAFHIWMKKKELCV